MYGKLKKQLDKKNKKYDDAITHGLNHYFNGSYIDAQNSYLDTNNICNQALTLIKRKRAKKPNSTTLIDLEIEWLQKKVQIFRNLNQAIENYTSSDNETITKITEYYTTQLESSEQKTVSLIEDRVLPKLDFMSKKLNQFDQEDLKEDRKKITTLLNRKKKLMLKKRKKEAKKVITQANSGIKLMNGFFGEKHTAYNAGPKWDAHFLKTRYYFLYNQGKTYQKAAEYQEAIDSYQKALNFLKQHRKDKSLADELKLDQDKKASDLIGKEMRELTKNMSKCRKLQEENENNVYQNKKRKLR